jgi:hypothetical protein
MMIVFPQLSSGAIAQFPFQSRRSYRTLVNESVDGAEIRVADADFEKRSWLLSLDELSDDEWQSVEGLFAEREGRLRGFVFLEPGANLLSWSGQLEETAWDMDAGFSVTDGQPDPFGGTAAQRVTNGGSAGSVTQTLNIPGWFRYAGSVWARSAQSDVVLQVDDSGSQVVQAPIEDNNQWKRYSLGYGLASASEFMAFRIVVPAGAVVDVFGPQLEAQASPSAYKQSGEQAGVYPDARFDQDVLGDRLAGEGRHSGEVRIVWARSQA